MKKITIAIDDENEPTRVGHLELTDETMKYFENVGIDAIESSIVEVIRRMLEESLKDKK